MQSEPTLFQQFEVVFWVGVMMYVTWLILSLLLMFICFISEKFGGQPLHKEGGAPLL